MKPANFARIHPDIVIRCPCCELTAPLSAPYRRLTADFTPALAAARAGARR
jgi:hypothetical protein